MSVRELTPRGRGGVAVLDIRGAAAVGRLAALAAPTRLPGVGELRLLRLMRAGELVDEALCLGLAPDAFELHLHGSPPLVRYVSAVLSDVAPASEPERDAASRRPAAERDPEALAARRLAHAPSEAAARVLLDQAEGALTRALDRLALAEPPRCARGLEQLLKRASDLWPLFAPPRVVLAGPVNAGKSTLFNVLVGHERVVVSGEAGTTRDAIEERVLLGPYAVDLVDTAGDRALDGGASDELERTGQSLARERRAAADLVLWLVPLGSEMPAPRTPPGRGPVVTLRTRADEASGQPREGEVAIAARAEPLAARERVAALVGAALGLVDEPWQAGRAVLFDQEQIAGLRALLGALPIECDRRRRALRAAVRS